MNSYLHKSSWVLAFATVSIHLKANSAILVRFDIANAPGAENPLAASEMAQGVSATALTLVGVSPMSNIGTFGGGGQTESQGWPIGVRDSGKFIGFSVIPDQGNAITFSSISYALFRTAPGIARVDHFELRASTDAFVSSDVLITQHDLSSSLNAGQVIFSGIDLSSLGTQLGPVTFRLFGWADIGSSTAGLGNAGFLQGTGADLVLQGSVGTAIPEPSISVIFSGMALAGLGIWHWFQGKCRRQCT